MLRLEPLHEVVPMTSIIALLMNPTSPNAETLSSEPAGGGPHAWA
jgi:hypothetical protein